MALRGAKQGGDEQRGPCGDGLALGYSPGTPASPSVSVCRDSPGSLFQAANSGAQNNIPGGRVYLSFYNRESISRLVLAASRFVKPCCLAGAWLLNTRLYIHLVLTLKIPAQSCKRTISASVTPSPLDGQGNPGCCELRAGSWQSRIHPSVGLPLTAVGFLLHGNIVPMSISSCTVFMRPTLQVLSWKAARDFSLKYFARSLVPCSCCLAVVLLFLVFKRVEGVWGCAGALLLI